MPMAHGTLAPGSCAVPPLPAPLESCVLISQSGLLPNLLITVLVIVINLAHYFILYTLLIFYKQWNMNTKLKYWFHKN